MNLTVFEAQEGRLRRDHTVIIQRSQKGKEPSGMTKVFRIASSVMIGRLHSCAKTHSIKSFISIFHWQKVMNKMCVLIGYAIRACICIFHLAHHLPVNWGGGGRLYKNLMQATVEMAWGLSVCIFLIKQWFSACRSWPLWVLHIRYPAYIIHYSSKITVMK